MSIPHMSIPYHTRNGVTRPTSNSVCDGTDKLESFQALAELIRTLHGLLLEYYFFFFFFLIFSQIGSEIISKR